MTQENENTLVTGRTAVVPPAAATVPPTALTRARRQRRREEANALCSWRSWMLLLGLFVVSFVAMTELLAWTWTAPSTSGEMARSNLPGNEIPPIWPLVAPQLPLWSSIANAFGKTWGFLAAQVEEENIRREVAWHAAMRR